MWALRGTEFVGPKVLSHEEHLATVPQLNLWDRQFVEPYLAADAQDRVAAQRYLNQAHGLGLAWIAVRGGVSLALTVIADATDVHFSAPALEGLRGLIAGLPDDEYEACATQASDSLGGLADGPLAFLFPTEPWASDIADRLHSRTSYLAPQVSSSDLASVRLPDGPHGWYKGYVQEGTLAASLLRRFGAPVVSLLPSVGYRDFERERLLVISRVGSDQAFRLMVDGLGNRDAQKSLAWAARREPIPAIRVLSDVQGKYSDVALHVLRDVVAKYPLIVDEIASSLSPKQRSVIAAVATTRNGAPVEAVPAVLVRPPWMEKGGRPARPIVQVPAPIAIAATLDWSEPEREKARRNSHHGWDKGLLLNDLPTTRTQLRELIELIIKLSPGRAWTAANIPSDVTDRDQHLRYLQSRLEETEASLQRYPRGSLDWATEKVAAKEPITPALLATLDGDLALEALNCTADTSSSSYLFNDDPCLRVLAVHGMAAESYLASAFNSAPAKFVRFLNMLGSTQFAPGVAKAVGSRAARSDALAWLRRFPEHAAGGLIARAVGPLGLARDQAEFCLRYLVSVGEGDTVRRVAASAGAEVASAVDAVLALDPLSHYPTKRPAVPAWLVPAHLEPVVLRSGAGELGDDAVQTLLTMLAFSRLDNPYAGIEISKQACTAESLERFSWSVFTMWQANGWPSSASWAMTQLGLLGGDDAARSLAALIRVWPGEGGHARATLGLDVLAAMGTDVSLMHLNRIAETVKFKGLKEKARAKIAEIAEARDLTKEELADRLVPDLGLDDDGSMWLDFGPRRFRVGFDEVLAPFIRDQSGAKLRALPKPNAKDDPEKADAATRHWKGLKKDATDASKLQIRRIELAMCSRRRWTAETFSTLFVGHPLMRHVSSRLVWGVYEGVELQQTFRVAEDRSLADVNDDAWTLPETEALSIGLPHRLELSEELAAAWGQVLTDYELLQPFAQLGRDTHLIAETERTATELVRFKGQECHFGKILGLEFKGWNRGTAWEGYMGEMLKPLRNGWAAVLVLEEGLFTPAMTASELQRIDRVVISRSADAQSFDKDAAADRVDFGSMDPIEFSELVRDLESLRT